MSVFVLSCVQVAALRRADPSSKESYRLCIGLIEKAANVQRAVKPESDALEYGPKLIIINRPIIY